MIKVTGSTGLLGVMGNPIAHSISPVIHNTISERLGKNLIYVPFLVDKTRVKEAVEGAYALNLQGINVTVPFKSEVIPFLKDMDPLAEKIGAVNTMKRIEDGYKGYNTDMPGLYRAMQEDGITFKGEDVVVLGAGGVARAVVILLAEKGARKVYLLNRTVAKAESIAAEVNAMYDQSLVCPMKIEDYSLLPESRFLTIQTTNVGMYPKTEEAVITDPSFYRRVKVGYDLIFNPLKTNFMKLTEAAGGQAYNGLKMLLYQGIIAYEIWNGCEVDEETIQLTFQEMKKEMGME